MRGPLASQNEAAAAGETPSPSKLSDLFVANDLTAEQLLPSWEARLLQDLQNCTFRPQLSATARRRPTRSQRSFADDMREDWQRRSEHHEARLRQEAERFHSWFVPEIASYSRSLRFDAAAHQRLHKCWGAQLRDNLLREAETCDRIRSVTASPPPSRRSPSPRPSSAQERPRPATPAAVISVPFHASTSSTAIARKRVGGEFARAVGGDADELQLSRDRVRRVLAAMKFISSAPALIPSEADALQRVFELLDPSNSDSVAVGDLLGLVQDLAVGDARNDLRLIALKFGRMSRSNRGPVPQAVAPPKPAARRLRRRSVSAGRLWEKSAKSRQRIEMIRSQEEAKLRSQCPFQPTMRTMSPSLTRAPKKRMHVRQLSLARKLPLSDLLHNDQQKKKETLQRLQAEAQRKADEQFRRTCTFKPTITRARSLSPCATRARLPNGFVSYVHRVRNATAIADAAERARIDAVDQEAQSKREEIRQNQLYYEKRIASRLRLENDDDRPVVCVVSIQLTPTKSQHIKLRLGDDPDQVARTFCKRHMLPTWARDDLRSRLNEQLGAFQSRPKPAPSIEDIADWDVDLIARS